jgi:uncharacterized protein (DUF169 family)
MEKEIKDKFLTLWKKYFKNADLPITFYYSKSDGNAKAAVKPKKWRCFIADLGKVRKGQDLYFNKESLGCNGGKRYLGYTKQLAPDFRYFLSCGIEGKLEGERYKKTPEIVDELIKHQINLPIDNKNIVFKRWDKLTERDNPEVIIFFATPDVLSGLFTLASFDSADQQSSVTPFGAGCSSIVHYPYLEKDKEDPKAIIGMFDASARPCVPENTLSFAVPFKKFVKMLNDMEESFLITDTWNTVMKRIK